jgi:hypothetical protein
MRKCGTEGTGRISMFTMLGKGQRESFSEGRLRWNRIKTCKGIYNPYDETSGC